MSVKTLKVTVLYFFRTDFVFFSCSAHYEEIIQYVGNSSALQKISFLPKRTCVWFPFSPYLMQMAHFHIIVMWTQRQILIDSDRI